MILEVLAHTRQVVNHRYADAVQVIGRADARTQERVGRTASRQTCPCCSTTTPEAGRNGCDHRPSAPGTQPSAQYSSHSTWHVTREERYPIFFCSFSNLASPVQAAPAPPDAPGVPGTTTRATRLRSSATPMTMTPAPLEHDAGCSTPSQSPRQGSSHSHGTHHVYCSRRFSSSVPSSLRQNIREEWQPPEREPILSVQDSVDPVMRPGSNR